MLPVFAAAFAVGTAWGGLGAGASPLLFAALMTPALALGRRALTVGLLALGMGGFNGGLRGGFWVDPPEWVAPARPLVVEATALEGWERTPFGWTRTVRARWLRQGHQMETWHGSLRVTLPDGPPPEAADRLRLTGFLRRTSGLGNDPPKLAGVWRLHVKSTRFVQPVGRVGARRPVGSFRTQVEEALISQGGDSPGSRLARALVLGDRRALPRDLQQGLARVGLAHLLAISGLHVGILGAVAYVLARPLPVVVRGLAPLAAAGAYLLLIGPRASILRAAAMIGLAGGAIALSRPPAAIQTLSCAALGILLLEPAAVAHLGFLLTFSATAGIVLLSSRLAERWERLPRWASRPLAVSVAAQVGTIPWAVPAFHLLHPAAPLLNLLAIPWTALALTGGLLWAALVTLEAPAAAWLLGGLDRIALPYEWCAELPTWPVLSLPRVLSRPAAACAAGCMALALAARTRRVRRPVWALTAVLLLAPVDRPPNDRFEVIAFDVGQGEAVLLRNGARGVLVDGGGWTSGDIARDVLLPVLSRLGVRRLEAAVVSHPDLDHCQGLADLAQYLAIREVWTGVGSAKAACVTDLLLRPGTSWRPLWSGRVASAAGWRFEVLHPPAGDRGDGNDGSLVLRASAAGSSLLLTGDIEAAAERRILARHRPARLSANVLKVAHHGSKTSTGERFLRAVRPGIALISAGRRNRYGHPAPPVVERLERHGVEVRRTDREGMVRLEWPPDTRARSAG